MGLWETAKLGQFCKVIAGQSPDGKFYNDTGNGLPFYQGKKDFGQKFIGKPRTWTSQVTKEALAGDILMSVRAPVGPINFAVEKACIGRGLAAIRATDKVDRDFLFYGLLLIQREISGNEGAVFASINKKQIEDIELPLPPLPEQKRIVAILDEAFAGIDAAVANTEKNLAKGRELFESYLNGVFTRKGEGLVEKKLGDVCKFSSGGTPSKKNNGYWNGKIPWVSGRDMKSTQLFDSQLHISQTAVDESATRLAAAGSLVVLVRGMGLAHGAQVAELMVASAFNQDIKGIHPESYLMPRYLVFMLRHQINSSDNVLSSAAHGTLKINTDAMKALRVIIPPYDQQNQIVGKIDSLKIETQHLETIYQQKLAALAELKQAILQKAFAGELTALPDQALAEAVA